MSSKVHRECLPELAQLRRGASRLRRMLAPHRQLFGALARPDFRPSDDGVADKQFRALEQRFERAMDAVENTRDLVVGSFELYATRSAERTNDTVRALTFVTVLLGSLAVVAGALGMNFKTPFFDTGDRGFWTAIVAMACVALVASAHRALAALDLSYSAVGRGASWPAAVRAPPARPPRPRPPASRSASRKGAPGRCTGARLLMNSAKTAGDRAAGR